MIIRIVPIVPVVSKNFERIGTTETIAGFHKIVSIASKTEDTRSSAMFLGPTTEFWRDIRKQNGGRQSQSESPGLLSSYSFDFAPQKSSKNPMKTQVLGSTDISEARGIRSLQYSGTRAQTA